MSETEYNFQLIEKKAQKYWEENKSFEVEPLIIFSPAE